MIDAIGQYHVSIKGQNFYEVRVTNLKKELTLTKDLMKHHMVEWQKKKKGCSIILDGWNDKREIRCLNYLTNGWSKLVNKM